MSAEWRTLGSVDVQDDSRALVPRGRAPSTLGGPLCRSVSRRSLE